MNSSLVQNNEAKEQDPLISTEAMEWLARKNMSATVELRELPTSINKPLKLVGNPKLLPLSPNDTILSDDEFVYDATHTIHEALNNKFGLNLAEVHYWAVYSNTNKDHGLLYTSNPNHVALDGGVLAGFAYISKADLLALSNEDSTPIQEKLENLAKDLEYDLAILGGWEQKKVYDLVFNGADGKKYSFLLISENQRTFDLDIQNIINYYPDSVGLPVNQPLTSIMGF